jgi:hypothetical protein
MISLLPTQWFEKTSHMDAGKVHSAFIAYPYACTDESESTALLLKSSPAHRAVTPGKVPG